MSSSSLIDIFPSTVHRNGLLHEKISAVVRIDKESDLSSILHPVVDSDPGLRKKPKCLGPSVLVAKQFTEEISGRAFKEQVRRDDVGEQAGIARNPQSAESDGSRP